MNEDHVYWVVQQRTNVFATWKPIALFTTEERARNYERNSGGGARYKVDRVLLYS